MSRLWTNLWWMSELSLREAWVVSLIWIRSKPWFYFVRTSLSGLHRGKKGSQLKEDLRSVVGKCSGLTDGISFCCLFMVHCTAGKRTCPADFERHTRAARVRPPHIEQQWATVEQERTLKRKYQMRQLKVLLIRVYFGLNRVWATNWLARKFGLVRFKWLSLLN